MLSDHGSQVPVHVPSAPSSSADVIVGGGSIATSRPRFRAGARCPAGRWSHCGVLAPRACEGCAKQMVRLTPAGPSAGRLFAVGPGLKRHGHGHVIDHGGTAGRAFDAAMMSRRRAAHREPTGSGCAAAQAGLPANSENLAGRLTVPTDRAAIGDPPGPWDFRIPRACEDLRGRDGRPQ